MIVHTVEQRSPEWHALRCGRVTGSCADAILKVRQRGSGELAVRRDLRQRLIVERLTGVPVEDLPYKGKDIQHGIDTEPEGISAYEAARGEIVTRVGFVSHDTLMAGCSPDGCIGAWDGCIEVKCPASETHLDYLKAQVVPPDYYPQLVHTLWITGAPWVDFISYDPRFLNSSKRLFIKRLTRDGINFAAYELAVSLFLSEVDKEVAALQPQEEVAF